jgi:hypothetical protein
MEMENQSKEEPTSLGKLVRYFLYLGTVGFGGPAALVGFMHRDLVERRRWNCKLCIIIMKTEAALTQASVFASGDIWCKTTYLVFDSSF